MKVKKIILIIILILIIAGFVFLISKTSNNTNKNEIENEKLQIVSTNFASYDFLRAIVGDNRNVELIFLLGAGKDAHSYDPTAGDLIKIQNADLFVYIGGESEKWVEKVLESLENTNTKKICIADAVDKIEEQEVDGAEKESDEEEEEGAFDDHIWTSPKNAIKMVQALEKAVEELDSINSLKYKENAEKLISEIKDVDSKMQNIVNNKVRDRLVFADRMPMQYFMNYYKLRVSAAFSGCSTETEPSAKTIAYLQNKIKEEKIPVVLYIELNDGRVAKTIAKETGIKAMQIQTLHNISLNDFREGETWVSLMNRNLEVLKAALQ